MLKDDNNVVGQEETYWDNDHNLVRNVITGNSNEDLDQLLQCINAVCQYALEWVRLKLRNRRQD